MSSMVVGVLVVSACFFGAMLVLIPRLVIRPLHRNQLWRLRDEVSLARRSGQLTYSHPAPLALVHRIEAAIMVSDYLSLPKLAIAALAARNVPQEVLDSITQELNPDLTLLGAAEVEEYLYYDRRLRTLTAVAPFISWSGLIMGTLVLLCLAVVAPVAKLLGEHHRVREEVREGEKMIEVIALGRARQAPAGFDVAV